MPTLHGTLLKAAGLLLALTTAVAAQDYPNKPVRLIIPFPPGGSNDVVGRLIATHLSERLGKQVVVDNRGAGAGGVVGTEVAANAPHDGYTLLHHLARARGQSVALQAALRSDQVVHPDRHSRLRTERAGGQSRAAGAFGAGSARRRQGEARPAAICLGRYRQLPASRRRTVQARPPASTSCMCRSRAAARHDRRDRRPYQGDVQLAGADHAAHPLGQAARARHRRIEPQSGAARRADDRGSRRAGLRGRQLVGRRGAGRHAGRHRREAAQGHRRGAGTPTR